MTQPVQQPEWALGDPNGRASAPSRTRKPWVWILVSILFGSILVSIGTFVWQGVSIFVPRDPLPDSYVTNDLLEMAALQDRALKADPTIAGIPVNIDYGASTKIAGKTFQAEDGNAILVKVTGTGPDGHYCISGISDKVAGYFVYDSRVGAVRPVRPDDC